MIGVDLPEVYIKTVLELRSKSKDIKLSNEKWARILANTKHIYSKSTRKLDISDTFIYMIVLNELLGGMNLEGFIDIMTDNFELTELLIS